MNNRLENQVHPRGRYTRSCAWQSPSRRARPFLGAFILALLLTACRAPSAPPTSAPPAADMTPMPTLPAVVIGETDPTVTLAPTPLPTSTLAVTPTQTSTPRLDQVLSLIHI